jgi:hypothetical protein
MLACLILVHRHSLSDINGGINELLRDTKAIRADMAHDQTTLRGSISIAASDTSDTELELEEKGADSKAYRQAIYPATKGKNNAVGNVVITPEEYLIDLTEQPSILDAEIDEKVSPALEELRTLSSGFGGSSPQAPEWMSKTSNAVLAEKRDSATSTTVPTPSLYVSETGESSRRTSEIWTPLSAEPNGGPFFGRSYSLTSSNQSAALESEFPEVVPAEGLEPSIHLQPLDPFPVVEFPPILLPPTTAQESVILQKWQQEAMESGDAKKQLDWAEDALHFTCIGFMYRERISKLQKNPTEASYSDRMLETDAKKVVENHLQQGNPKALFLKAAYFGLNMAQSNEIYLLSLARGYSRSAFYIGQVYEANKATLSAALGYYNQGASAGDSACQYVSTPFPFRLVLIILIIC